ncbi:MAG TPA: PRC-barrel domain-containing protein [Solirubrobacteraceae bacterium]|jgi:sporulation protein YlmC with PRC-barrel domain|nr:PRC-barrel domain-containing protein [Solirubrobacteraceae bacterium]
MSERFTAAMGRRAVSRASAEELGTLAHLVVDVPHRKVSSLVLGKGRKAVLVDWDQVSGFGPDAVMIAAESALHQPRDGHEKAAADGKLELVGRRVLSDTGDGLGESSDVVFDPASGSVETLVVGDTEVPATSILGAGSYAVVVKAPSQ